MSHSTLRYVSPLLFGSPAFCASESPNNARKSAPYPVDILKALQKPPPKSSFFTHARSGATQSYIALQTRLKFRTFPVEGISDNKQSQSADPRKVVLVVGGGWAATAFVPRLDPRVFKVVWVSPSPTFSFTPLLPSVLGGDLNPSACRLNLRNLLRVGSAGQARGVFREAAIVDVDPKANVVTCQSVGEGPRRVWNEKYDFIVLAVGTDTNTFGIPGVEERATFLKTADDAEKLRKKIRVCFEEAAEPDCTESKRKSLLSFVFVGGGPTGVESAAECSDFLRSEGKRLYPQLAKYFRVILVEMLPTILPTMSPSTQAFALKNFKEMGVEVMLNSAVTAIDDRGVVIKSKVKGNSGADEFNQSIIPSQLVLWASGIKPASFALSTSKLLPDQHMNGRLLVDPSFRVFGSTNMFALGDCCTIMPLKLEDYAKDLWMLSNKENPTSEAGTDWLVSKADSLSRLFPQVAPTKFAIKDMPRSNNLDLEAFTALLKKIDAAYRPPVPTAQNAAQEGKYLAEMFNWTLTKAENTTHADAYWSSFVDIWKGSACSLGNGNAALETPVFNVIGGFGSRLLWKMLYLQMQLSGENIYKCLTSWIKSSIFGRDLA